MLWFSRNRDYACIWLRLIELMSCKIFLGDCSLVIGSTTNRHFKEVTIHANQIFLKCHLKFIIPILFAVSTFDRLLSTSQNLSWNRNSCVILLLRLFDWRLCTCNIILWCIACLYNFIFRNHRNARGWPCWRGALNTFMWILPWVVLLIQKGIVADKVI